MKGRSMTYKGVPARFQDATVPPDIKIDLSKSWFIFGKPGTGKTRLIWGYRIKRKLEYDARLEKEHNLEKLPVVTMKNWAAFCSEIRYTSFENREDVIKHLKRTPQLIIDDLGSEVKTEFSDDILYQILDHRWQHALETAFTSNHKISELEYDDRVLSRIRGIVEKNQIELTGKDWRLK